jgi:hypothetical protein
VPIVSISKIQHRYGLSDNGPSNSSTLQLSAAELGWEIDTRRLFIGNGPISEGAPEIGNTEVLTQYSDILGIASSYQYKGEAAGYTAITGSDANNPTTRTLQRKLDEFASVKDFGAVGDGVTDDTVAINRAFNELFARESNTEVRRSLFFPAGVYRVTDTVKIPTYAKVYGEGKNSSIIKLDLLTGESTTATAVVTLADSKQQISPNIGSGGATIPSFIEINDISFENTETGNVIEISSSQNCILRRINLKGSQSTAPTSVGTGESTVEITSTAVNQTKNILFEQCDIVNNVFGVVADNDMQGILFNGCYFNNLYKGVKLGENTSGSGASINGPKGVKVTNSIFDNIYNTGIHVYDIGGIVSAYNYFADVGNNLNGTGNPTADVVIFEGNGNASINDIFDRTDADDATNPRLNINGKSVYALNSTDGIFYGYHKTEAGKSVTLTDNTSGGNSGISFSASEEKSNLIYYTASRGSNVRHGVMRVTASSSGSTLTDEYNEDGADIGLEFAVNVSSGTTTLNYTTTNTGNDVTFKYRVERLT